MPKFDVEVDEHEIEIDAEEFYIRCNNQERRDMVDILISGGYIEDPDDNDVHVYTTSDQLNQWGEIIGTLESDRMFLTIKEETAIRNIVKRLNPKIQSP